jgi:hypothetical protein
MHLVVVLLLTALSAPSIAMILCDLTCAPPTQKVERPAAACHQDSSHTESSVIGDATGCHQADDDLLAAGESALTPKQTTVTTTRTLPPARVSAAAIVASSHLHHSFVVPHRVPSLKPLRV